MKLIQGEQEEEYNNALYPEYLKEEPVVVTVQATCRHLRLYCDLIHGGDLPQDREELVALHALSCSCGGALEDSLLEALKSQTIDCTENFYNHLMGSISDLTNDVGFSHSTFEAEKVTSGNFYDVQDAIRELYVVADACYTNRRTVEYQLELFEQNIRLAMSILLDRREVFRQTSQ